MSHIFTQPAYMLMSNPNSTPHTPLSVGIALELMVMPRIVNGLHHKRESALLNHMHCECTYDSCNTPLKKTFNISTIEADLQYRPSHEAFSPGRAVANDVHGRLAEGERAFLTFMYNILMHDR